MKVLRFIPIIFSFLMLAAHFSRLGNNIIAVLIILTPFLLFIKKAFIARIIQIVLIAGAAEWIRAMFYYIDIRKGIGEDWTRLAIILSAVSLFTLLSALIFQTKSMKKTYELK